MSTDKPASTGKNTRTSPRLTGKASPVLTASSPQVVKNATNSPVLSSIAPPPGFDEKEAAGAHRDNGPIICPGHSRPVPDCTYSNVTEDGYFLISACLDGKAMLREGPTGDWIGTFMGHKGAVWSARLNSLATLAATASGDFSAKLWDAISGNCLHTLQHKHIVKTVQFSKDSKQLYTGGNEKKIRIFDLEKPDAEARVLDGHEATIGNIVLTPSPHLIVSCASENNVRVWDLRTGASVQSLPTDNQVTSMTLSNDNDVITTTHGSVVTMWNSTTFEKIKSFTLQQTVDCAAYHPATKKFVTGSNDELWVRGYDFESGEEIACNKGHHGPVRCLCFSPDGLNYASGSEDGTIRIWEWGN